MLKNFANSLPCRENFTVILMSVMKNSCKIDSIVDRQQGSLLDQYIS